MPNKMPSILVGALAHTVVSVLVTLLVASGGMGMAGSAIGCLSLFVASVAAVAHYTSTHRLTIPAGQGAGLGAAATLVGVLVAFAVTYLLQTLGVTPSPEEMMEIQRAELERQGMSAEQIEQGMAMGEKFSSPLIALAISIPMGAIAGAIGGAVTALIVRKGDAA